MPTFKTYIELEVEVEYHGTPYVPAKVSGPPESCYPEEGGEVEIQEVVLKFQEKLPAGCKQVVPEERAITNLLSSKQTEQLESKASEDWVKKQRDFSDME